MDQIRISNTTIWSLLFKYLNSLNNLDYSHSPVSMCSLNTWSLSSQILVFTINGNLDSGQSLKLDPIFKFQSLPGKISIEVRFHLLHNKVELFYIVKLRVRVRVRVKVKVKRQKSKLDPEVGVVMAWPTTTTHHHQATFFELKTANQG